MRLKKLLIIDKHPFGTLTDVVKWCEYSKNYYDITLLCLDSKKKLEMSHINIIRTRNFKNYFLRGLNYIITALVMIIRWKGPIFAVYFPNISIIRKLIPWKKVHLDIRTLSVEKNDLKRAEYDNKLRSEALLFNSVSTLSTGIADKLNLNNIYYLPLGSDTISDIPKKYTDSIRLLYVGTLNNRNIIDCIHGVNNFIKQFPDIRIHFDIIGSGLDEETIKIVRAIEELELEDVVKFHGRIEHKGLKPFFDTANIGLSYIPMKEYYNYQPPTKTYEYLMSGLFCVATNTNENKKIITEGVGILINDNADSLTTGLKTFWDKRKSINYNNIINHCKDNKWSIVTPKYFIPIINRI